MSKKKKKYKPVNSQEKYVNAKSKYLSEINNFNDSEEEKTNAKIKEHLYKMIDLIDSMSIASKGINALNAFLIKLKNLLGNQKPIQALVFYFDDNSGDIFLSSFGALNLATMMDTELSLANRLDNQIIKNLGPIKVSNYDSIYEDALYLQEIGDCTLEYENDSLRELAILKAYAIFEKTFLSLDLKHIFSDIQILRPFYSYIQEHDGGYSNLLSVEN